MPQNLINVRYMIDDVDAAVEFYTKHLGFVLEQNASPAFASVTRGNLRLLLSGEKSSGRRPLKDGTKPMPGGWNRISLWVEDLEAEIARLRKEGVKFRRDDVISGPGGSQSWLEDPSGNLVELSGEAVNFRARIVLSDRDSGGRLPSTR
ncbi:MAG TPA: VOC family protein [Patescibacteria group bacterium]|nr:VOC family protein [Patescibacteria group bacterium]